jgi:hypothetical protein
LLTLNTLTRTNLELPLSGHNLGVGSRDLYTGEQASFEVSLDDISAIDLSGTNTTVVWALGAWETILGPAIWFIGHIKKSVLLLETEPRLVLLMRLHQLGSLMTVVEFVRGSIGIPALGDHQDIWGTTEWIREDCNRSKVNVGVIARCLASGASVEVPLREILNGVEAALWDTGERLEEEGDQYSVVRARLEKGRMSSYL